ncbi:MAG: hypothetical protein KDF65_04510 [Anaerolineae bacterium]|nr:hypothetical protein [Anaerolineae bacterium]
MKVLKIISLGLALWGMTLIWPEVNQHLTEPVTLKLIGGLSLVMLAYIIAQHLDWGHHHHHPRPSNSSHASNKANHKPNHVSRPVPVN